MKIAEFLQEDDGGFSSMRLVTVCWLIGPLALWTWLGIKNGTMAEIPETVIVVLGMVLTGKVTQKVAEKMKAKTPDTNLPGATAP